MNDATDKDAKGTIRWRSLAFLLEKLSWLTVACVLLGLLGRYYFALELLSHFRIQQTAVLIISAILLFFLRHRRAFWFSLISGSILSLSLAPFFFSGGKADSGNRNQYKLVSLNVLFSNQEKQKVVDYLIKEDPDFVFLYETDTEWIRFLQKSKLIESENLLWQQFHADAQGGGIAFFSKHKVNYRFHNSIDAPKVGSDSIEISFETRDGKTVHLHGIHPPPPLSPQLFLRRNQTFQFIAERVQQNGSENTIVSGDFNCTPWSPYYSQFVRDSELVSAAYGTGLGITWDPFGKALGLPIDHVFTGKGILTADFQIGPYVGSDHRPLVLKFQ